MGVEHLAQGENFAGNGGGLQQLGWAFTLISNANAVPRLTVVGNKVAYGRKSSASRATCQGIIGTKLTNLFGEKAGVVASTITQITIGFRATKAADATPGLGMSVFGLSLAAPTASTTGLFTGVYWTGSQWWFNTGGTNGRLSSSDEVYIEIVLRVVSGNAYLDIWADGVKYVNNYATTWNWNTLFSTGYTNFGIGINGGLPDQDGAGTAAKDFLYVSDLYVTLNDGTVGDNFAGRLGPVKVRRCPVVQAANTDWTSSDGVMAVKDILNLRRDINNSVDQTLAPYAISGPSASAVNCQVDASGINVTMLALQVNASAVHPAGDSGNMQIDVISGGSSILTKQFTDIPAPGVFNDRTPLPIVSIGGAAPTPASVNALTIAVKPI